MAIVLGAVYEVKLLMSTATDIAINVLHYVPRAVSGSPVVTELTAVAAFDTQFRAPYRNLMSAFASFDQVSMQKLAPPPAEDAYFSALNPQAGLIAEDLLPRQVCGLIQKRTGLAGRANRGRFFVAYPDEGSNSPNGAPTPAYLVLLGLLADAVEDDVQIVDAGGILSFDPVVYHRGDNTYTFINSAGERAYWATQRRRNNNRF